MTVGARAQPLMIRSHIVAHMFDGEPCRLYEALYWRKSQRGIRY